MESGGDNSQPPHPRARANPLSAITFWWMLDVFRMGYQRDIETSDLYIPLNEHKSDYLGDKFERYWFKELIRAKKSDKKPSLLRVIVKSYGLEFIFYGLMRALVEIFIRLAQPLFLGQLLLYFSPGNLVTKSEAYWYAAGVVACSVIIAMVVHPYMMAMFHLGMKIRIASCSLIYRKALRLNRTALGETTVGQVVNLLSNDVHYFDRSLLFLHYLWLGPLESLIVAYFVYVELGAAGIGGIIAMLLFIPVQGFLGKKTSVFRLRTAICTDERVRLMNEIISGIQVIKLYTWEMPFAKLVSIARKKEIHVIRLTSYIRSIIPSLSVFVTRFGIYLSILSFVFTGNTITAQKVFVITAYYNILKTTMSNSFPKGIADAAEGWVSVGRVQKFLLYEELEVSPKIAFTKGKAVNDTHSNETFAITMTKGTAKWLPQSPENTLININLSVRPGQLVAVIGPVGTGKTSLLNAILGELPLSPDGSLQVNGTVSYAAQEPWLFSASVRQNILFGQPWDEQHYHRVLHACSLVRDLEELPHGDQTLVGERGVVLSGGQRARVNLARAVYSDADIYLLDDPLSAVDASVGRRLFEDCITGLLKNKTCLLVTHQLQHLSQVDHLVILNNGAVEAQGTYSQLQKTGLDFAKLLGKEEVSGEAAEEDVQNGKKRSVSPLKVSSTPSKDKSEAAPQMQVKETRASGRVQGNVYQSYFSAAGNCCVLLSVAALFLLTPIVGMGTDLWLAHWSNLEELRSNPIQNSSIETSWNTSVTIVNDSNIPSPYDSEHIDSGWWFNLDTDLCIYIYSAFVGGTIFVALFRSMIFYNMCMRASTQLHNRMFNAMTRAPMHFFNTNPTGRILNRFSKDIGSIDEILPTTMIECFHIILVLGVITIMIAVLNYWLLVPTVVIGILFYFLRYFFLVTTRSVKRLEGITRSPVFTHLSASLQGLTTIRALRAQEVLIKEFDSHQDLNSTAFYIFVSANRAFGLWLDMGVIVYLTFVTFSFLLIGEGSFAGNVGLAITQTLGLMGMFQWGMRQSAELENQMTAVERVLEYTDIEQEPPLKTSPGNSPQKGWPSLGAITFDNVSLRYGETEPLVLKGISFTVRSMEKVGIVGRTGAGKSSLIAALFRLVETEGVILIDGKDTKNIGLHDLRGNLSIIPQEPVLFSGTLRRNLDPFDEYSDDLLWQALSEVELKNVVSDQVAGLNWRTSDGGSNLSVGQRQLVCLARAIIRNNKILVLDEATANVDPQTDALIQSTIRRKFANCTVLTIAHRLHTVMDSDRLLVVDAGRVVEFDQPHVLLQKPDGLLSGMVQQAGKATAEELVIVAKTNYNKSFHQKSS